MRYVRQEDAFGCGVACVANRLGISYGDAISLFESSNAAKTQGYACKYIVRALNSRGIPARLRHIHKHKPEPEYLDGDIVFLVKSKDYPYQHYLMKCADGWVDPWINVHQDNDVVNAKVGIRRNLPGRPYYRITVS